ncbi:hypothetical protein COO60DRAFT_1636059 [Scenedesmus sp. NREL 46B-D3]|nr:hypothetical protein COO60DRAFT_1636059 [Scenedesmus sp. NREL 46B-D3]
MQHQLQQTHAYHPATHRARVLTVRLQQQQHWQDLQLLYDASGGGARLNAIHLATVLQQLSRLAPMPELAPAAERRQLKAFTAEGCARNDLDRESSSDGDTLYSISSSGGSSISSSSGSFLDDLLQAVIKQLPSASSQSCTALCYSLATLLQQQQQHHGSHDLQQQRQRSVLLQQLVGAMSGRFKLLAAAGQLHSSDAGRAALAACRLAKAVRAANTAAVLDLGVLDAQLQELLQQAAQQAAQQAVHAAEAAGMQLAAGEAGVLLYSLAKARKVWKQQRQRQQQQQLLHQLHSCLNLWKELGSTLPVCGDVLPGMAPVQLAQLAAGLAKLVSISRAQVDAAAAAAAAAAGSSAGVSSNKDTSRDPAATQQQQKQQQPPVKGSAVAPAPADVQAAGKGLAVQLATPGLKQLLKQHVARVEGLLQMMPLAQRLQLADAYRQLGVQLPRSVSLVFDRDAAVPVALPQH